MLGVSDKTIRNHIKNGGPVETSQGRNKAAVLNITKWHNYLMELNQGDGNVLADTKLERQRQDLRKQVRENDEAEGNLIPLDQVEYLLESTFGIFSNNMEGIGGKACGGDPVIRARIQDETRFIRGQIFNDFVAFLRPFSGDRAADLATAEAVKLGMGERKADPT